MAKKKEKKPEEKIVWKNRFHLVPVLLFTVLVLLTLLTTEIILSDKFYPFTYIGDTNISLLTPSQASRVLSSKIQNRLNQTINFSLKDARSAKAREFAINLAYISAKIDYSSIDDAYSSQHPNDFKAALLEQLKALMLKTYSKPLLEINLNEQSARIAQDISKNPVNATLAYNEITSNDATPSANITIKESINGSELDEEKLNDEVKKYLIYGQFNNQLPVKITPPKVTTEHLKKSKKALQQLLTKPLTLRFDNNSWTIDAKQLLTMLDLETGQELLNKTNTYKYLDKIASEIDQKVVEGQFEFDANNKKVTVFKPSQDGRRLDRDKSYFLLLQALENQSLDINLAVEVVKPKVQTSQVNNLGIKELIGQGISNFAGSIPNRAFNVGLTASRINGTLVPPGEVFSFNQTIGEVSGATGYKQAYVIKEGRTVLDDGGGVCQDSTTLFRAVLNAGLPVVKRTAHAYRVGYYEQGFPPGLDATVFYPSVDFQFKNDTSTHILIQAYIVGNTLYVDLYGTSDGRVVELTKPVVTNTTPAPPELRQDDPTLPKGTVKQVDFAANGATVTFNRTVTRGNEVLNKETFRSVYKPWQAIYLVGTQ